MSRIIKSRRAVVLGVVGALAVAVAAYAYLSTTGAGSGSATVSAKAKELSLHSATVDLANLGATQTVHILADNDTDSAQAVASIDVSVAPVNSDCPDGSFTLSADNVVSGTNVAPNSTDTDVGTVDLTLNNISDAAQNACLEGAKLTYTGNAS
jgi:hypothetical protein